MLYDHMYDVSVPACEAMCLFISPKSTSPSREGGLYKTV